MTTTPTDQASEFELLRQEVAHLRRLIEPDVQPDHLEFSAAGVTLTFEELAAALAGHAGPIRLFVNDGPGFAESVCLTGIADILDPADDPEAVAIVTLRPGPYYGQELVAVPVEAASAIRALVVCWHQAIADTMLSERAR